METINTASQTILRDPEDWDLWLASVKIVATGHPADVWQYIDPDATTYPAEPVRPNIPSTPTAAELEDTKKQSAFRIQLDLYKIQLQEYRDIENKVGKVMQYIHGTIDKRHLLIIKRKTNCREVLADLKNALAPTDRTRKLLVKRKYNNLRKYNKSIHGPLEDFIDEWLKVYGDASDLRLSEIDDYQPQFDFLTSVSSIDSHWSTPYIQELERCLRKGRLSEIPSFTRLVDEYRNYKRLQVVQSSSRGASFPTLAGHDENGNETSQKQSISKGKGSKGNKDKRTRQSSTEPCLCGVKHGGESPEQCFMLNPNARPEGWTAHPLRIEKLNKKLRDDPNLRQRCMELGYDLYKEKSNPSSDPKDINKSSDKPDKGKSVGFANYKYTTMVTAVPKTPQHRKISKFAFPMRSSDRLGHKMDYRQWIRHPCLQQHQEHAVHQDQRRARGGYSSFGKPENTNYSMGNCRNTGNYQGRETAHFNA